MDARRSTVLNLVGYHGWANGKILESVEPLTHEELYRDMQTSHSSVWGTLEHMYRADTIWMSRFRGDGTARLDEVPQLASLAALRVAWEEVQSELLTWVDGQADDEWTRMMDYRLMSGSECQSPVYENVLHVVNHGTFHRGQIVTMLRQMGAKPVVTDFVHYVRTVLQSGF